jgi:hypothetical protein
MILLSGVRVELDAMLPTSTLLSTLPKTPAGVDPARNERSSSLRSTAAGVIAPAAVTVGAVAGTTEAAPEIAYAPPPAAGRSATTTPAHARADVIV